MGTPKGQTPLIPPATPTVSAVLGLPLPAFALASVASKQILSRSIWCCHQVHSGVSASLRSPPKLHLVTTPSAAVRVFPNVFSIVRLRLRVLRYAQDDKAFEIINCKTQKYVPKKEETKIYLRKNIALLKLQT